MPRVDFREFVPVITESVSALDVGRDYGLDPRRDGRCKCIFCTSRRKDGTLKLYPGSRGYYCFSCHASGDSLHLLMAVTGMKFPDAVREINDRYGLGLPLDKPDPERTRRAKEDADRRRQERAEKERRDAELLDEYWDAADIAYRAEQVIQHDAPRSMDEEPSDRFVAALKIKSEIEDCRDRLFDELHK